MALLGETVRLTHYGRKSGKPYDVTIWFVNLDGTTWIGSLSAERAWVKNLRATGKAALDFGDGPRSVRAVWDDSANAVERYQTAVREKYPIMGRLLGYVIRGRRCAFRVEPAAA
jgi:deazaflavin-dependent oxidoreductase (nitroreductase family)